MKKIFTYKRVNIAIVTFILLGIGAILGGVFSKDEVIAKVVGQGDCTSSLLLSIFSIFGKQHPFFISSSFLLITLQR
ncbi:hypothetical protein [Bacillus benzoevorans]|uniref:Uncharacterized protein n=1 Tax=Bacillus benzoevorans TaxID=1456 RepID=A0A7X0HUK5_9BACI|nr:hypothetical protein [Bacillus benzoevorans]MBB6447157.1 hypothetical protein [Bacillus benzoevorans]